jgi:hypothetical protein
LTLYDKDTRHQTRWNWWRIVSCDKQQGSVANAIKSALVKYQAVKKEGFNSEEAAETIHKEIEEATSLRCQCYKKHDNYFFFSFFRYLVGLLEL